MNIAKLLKRFLLPAPVVTGICWWKYKSKVSPKAEVELSPLLTLGRNSVISSFTKIKVNDGPLMIGANVSIATHCFISADEGGVQIGDYCMIGPNASIVGNNYRYDRLDVPICLQEKTSKGITIGQNVWIGAGCSILDGARIGDGAIVTPNTVVAGKIPENAIVQGNPAKVIFTRR